jgi:hypothetical protein
MAIQFPNFLSVPVTARDYSGMGDAVENFYKGYHMPKDALIKEIQAKFAEPNAKANLKSTELGNTHQEILNKYLPTEKELGLTSSRLSNKKSQMDINKLMFELAQQQALEKQFKAAFSGGAQQGGAAPAMPNGAEGGGMPPMMGNAPTMPQGGQGGRTLPGMPKGLPVPPGVPGMTMIGSPPPAMPPAAIQGGGQAMPSAPPMGMPNAGAAQQQPSMQSPAPEASNEVVISKGSPQLSGVDAMWDSNPLSRSFLEKKGFKKSQEVKFDNKSGKTTVITKYPSGKVTVLASAGAAPTENGIPLTNKMISKHQNIISSIDTALPTIEKILDEKGFQPYPRGLGSGLIPGLMSQEAKYDALVKSALDSLIGAYGLPMTNEGINTVKAQLQIGHGETTGNYRKRLRELVKDLKHRKEYSAGEVKKSNKITPVNGQESNSNSNEESYSSDDWEAV